MPYKLSATLTAHSSDVRALSSPTNELILSASRDATAISWQKPSPDAPFAPAAILKAGSRYVNSVAYIPPTPDAPKGYAVTGGQDTVINVFRLDAPRDDPDYSLLGHTENVCALDVTPGGTIISGSWDRQNFALVHDLKGHQQSVWAVLAVDEEQYLTGSADKTIKLWHQHKVLRTFEGHRDAVRGLALVPDFGFASCSNDSEVRVWTLGGDLIYTLSGHTSFVYSLTILPSGDIVSGGEDRTVRVWQDGECTQTIVHPAISVWAVSSMPNGDIVSGCSDGVVRVFSASEERWASQSDLKEYDEKVASQALPSQQVGDIKKSDLPGLEALSLPDNPFSAAQKFLESNDLPLTYIDEVVKFIEKNTAGVSIGTAGEDYVDPYTGASRYRSSASTASAPASSYQDPYTGASRYTGTPQASAPPVAASEYMDPFTGASRYSGASKPAAPAAPANILPVGKFIAFKQANVSAMQGKLQQFDDALRHEISTSSLAMYPDESNKVEESFDFLGAATATPPRKTSGSLSAIHIEAIIQILERWPSSQRFPGMSCAPHFFPVKADTVVVIDLSRLLTGFAPEAFDAPGLKERFVEALFTASQWNTSWTPPLSKPRETNILLLFRTLANVFQEKISLDGMWTSKVFEALSQAPYSSLNKNQRVALATILFNASCVSLRTPVDKSFFDQVAKLILRILESETSDSEAVYRALVGLGNLIHASKAQNLLDAGQSGELIQCIRALPTTFPEERVQNITREIAALVS
ncbi:hypothetical protein C0991_012584 [Blastosporella zonata]|nr:hypothetical protein C0991_012584 [Blastosporella zonata]